MKIHSYAFYNGHLSETERRLSELDSLNGQSEATLMSAAIRYPSSPIRERDGKDGLTLGLNREPLRKLREDLALELTSPLGHITYPQNLTFFNYLDFLFCPTLCYELEYPRTQRVRWLQLLLKTLAVFGCIFLLTVTSEEFIVPVLTDANRRLPMMSSLSEMVLILAETISMLLFPFIITFLLVFLVIFEYVLGAFAEITCFADRHFYSDWWNSRDWYVLEEWQPRVAIAVGLANTEGVLQVGILPQVEYSSPSFSSTPRLFFFKVPFLNTSRHVHHFLCERGRP